MFNHPMGGLYRWCMNGPDDETRATLLDAARTLLEADGPAALTVRRIAAEAGMSTMNVYSRFGGKDGVVDELYCEGFHRLREYVAKHAKSDDPVENFRAPGVAYRDFALENRTFYSVMFFRPIPGYVPSPAARRVALDGFDELVARIRELMDSGEIAELRSVQRGGLALGDVSRPRRARDQPRRAGRHRLGDDVPRLRSTRYA